MRHAIIRASALFVGLTLWGGALSSPAAAQSASSVAGPREEQLVAQQQTPEKELKTWLEAQLRQRGVNPSDSALRVALLVENSVESDGVLNEARRLCYDLLTAYFVSSSDASDEVALGTYQLDVTEWADLQLFNRDAAKTLWATATKRPRPQAEGVSGGHDNMAALQTASERLGRSKGSPAAIYLLFTRSPHSDPPTLNRRDATPYPLRPEGKFGAAWKAAGLPAEPEKLTLTVYVPKIGQDSEGRTKVIEVKPFSLYCHLYMPKTVPVVGRITPPRATIIETRNPALTLPNPPTPPPPPPTRTASPSPSPTPETTGGGGSGSGGGVPPPTVNWAAWTFGTMAALFLAALGYWGWQLMQTVPVLLGPDGERGLGANEEETE